MNDTTDSSAAPAPRRTIDIVNRRSIATSTTSKRASNIDHLKREISYLEREELKWDKFPKDNQEN
jgi:hypothetical protein